MTRKQGKRSGLLWISSIITGYLRRSSDREDISSRKRKGLFENVKNKSDFKRAMLKEINYKKIEEYMQVTREIWLWVLSKAFNNNIPDDQLYFFKDLNYI